MKPQDLGVFLTCWGVYPLVSLAEAREGREKAKKLLEQNIDPSVAKKKEQRRSVRNAQNTLQTTPQDRKHVRADQRLETHCNPIRPLRPHILLCHLYCVSLMFLDLSYESRP